MKTFIVIAIFLSSYSTEDVDCYKLLDQVLDEAHRVQEDIKNQDWNSFTDDFMYFLDHLQ